MSFNITSFSCYRGTSVTLNLNINFIWPFSKLFVFFLVLFNKIILNTLIPLPKKGLNTLKQFCRLLLKYV